MGQKESFLAEGAREPLQFLKEKGIVDPQIIFQIAVEIIFSQMGLKYLLAREADLHRIGVHWLMMIQAARHREAVEQMGVAHCAHGDIQPGCGLAIHFQKPTIAASRHRLVEAIQKRLARPKALMQSGYRGRQSLRPASTLRAGRAIDPSALWIVKMRDGDKDFHANFGKIMDIKIIFLGFLK